MNKQKKKSHIKKGDIVFVNAGKDKGKTGKVLKIDTLGYKAIVENINMVKKHKRAKDQRDKGGIITVEGPVDISNLNVFCKKCNTGVRVGIRESTDETGKKVKIRYCKKCKEETF